MKVILTIFVFLTLTLGGVLGKMCVSGNRTCTPGGGECDTTGSETCMQIPVGADGKIHSLCAAPLTENCFCDSSLTSAEACQSGLSCQEDKKKFLCLPSESVGPICGSTDRSWQLIYENNDLGGALGGTVIGDFVSAVRAGAEVKVLQEIPERNYYESLNIQKVSISFDDDLNIESVHGQNLHWVQPAPNNGYNLYSIYSSTGNAHYSQFFINDPVNRVRENSNVAKPMKWFVRRASGSLNEKAALSRAIQDGANVRVAINDSVRHLDVADLSAADKVQGISYEMRDKLNGEQFNTTEQWLFMHWSSDGSVQKSYWYVNKPEGTESEQLTDQQINWFVDTCWQFVYRHSGQGQALSGTLATLLDNINSGKRIKVKVEKKYHEVNILHIDNQGEVTAQVFDNWDDNVEDATWNWLEVSSTGAVKTVVLKVGDSSIISDVTSEKEVTWFAENRVWTSVGVAGLPAAVKNGSDFRFKVDFSGESVWYQADSITSLFGLLNEREFVFYDNKYHRRYSFGNYPKLIYQGDYVYMDYALGNITQASFQSYTTTVNYFFS